MFDKINNKIITYTPETETFLTNLGLTPLSDRDRKYMETLAVIVIENGRLIGASHWHYALPEFFLT